MAISRTSHDLNRFAAPDALREVDWGVLRAFLADYGGYFKGRGFPLPAATKTPDAKAYETLSHILMTPNDDTDPSMIRWLFLVQDLAQAANFDEIHEMAERCKVTLPSEPSLHDVLLCLAKQKPECLEDEMARHFLETIHRFECFSPKVPPSKKMEIPTERELAPFERAASAHFEKKHRGKGVKIFPIPVKDSLWLLIRHGGPRKRLEQHENGDVNTLLLRLAEYDVLVVHLDHGGLDIYVKSNSNPLKKFYCQQLSSLFFGRDDNFDNMGRFTLAPLKRSGRAALKCGPDVPEIEEVRLEAVKGRREESDGGALVLRQSWTGTDVFKGLEQRRDQLPADFIPDTMKCRVKFKDDPDRRAFSIHGGNIMQCSRKEDKPVIEHWLEARGFVTHRTPAHGKTKK